MSDKIKIGGCELVLPIRESGTGFLIDGNKVVLDVVTANTALNELAALRAANKVLEEQRDGLKREIQEAVEIIEAEEVCLKAEFGPNDIVTDAQAWLQRNKPTKDGV